MHTAIELTPFLEKLESMIDPGQIEYVSELQKKAFSFDKVDHIPTHIEYPLDSDEWPAYSHQEIFDDPGKMLLNELRSAYAGLKLRDDRLYGIRANYGTGIIASAFGCQIRSFDDTLPIGLHLEKTDLEAILDSGVPNVYTGVCGRALDTVEYYRSVLEPYPLLTKHIGSQMLDIQGPFDNATIIWGSDLYLAVLDEPDKVDRLMDIVTQTIKSVVMEHRRIDGRSVYEHDGDWNWLGGLCIRNDSSVNLSGSQYRELAKKHDAELLGEFGGWIHFCGRAHQWWKDLLDIKGLRGINPYQGEFYDLAGMYNDCKRSGIAIVQWTVPLDKASRELIDTGMSRLVYAPDYETARTMLDRLHSTGHVDA